jgi:hypothetical protein
VPAYLDELKHAPATAGRVLQPFAVEAFYRPQGNDHASLINHSPTTCFSPRRPVRWKLASGPASHGANWPQPSIWFDAIHAALYRAFPDKQEWEHTHRTGCNGKYDAPTGNNATGR